MLLICLPDRYRFDGYGIHLTSTTLSSPAAELISMHRMSEKAFKMQWAVAHLRKVLDQ